MKVATSIHDVRQTLTPLRRKGKTIGMVPTMGALHEGHLSLIRAARNECDVVAVTIFVNPIQFGPDEDLNRYPRPIEHDLDACRQESVDMVFNPDVAQMYPEQRLTTVRVEKLTEPLCGRSRPVHFDGVTTVVAKLFNILQPDLAYFGQKDAQQALVVRKMMIDLNIPSGLRICPTVRDETGLALSSRNDYLSDDQRRASAVLRQALLQAGELIGSGVTRSETILAALRKTLTVGKVEYVNVMDPYTLTDVATVEKPVLIALAVHVGPARLIDNILLDTTGCELTMNHLFDLPAGTER